MLIYGMGMVLLFRAVDSYGTETMIFDIYIDYDSLIIRSLTNRVEQFQCSNVAITSGEYFDMEALQIICSVILMWFVRGN